MTVSVRHVLLPAARTTLFLAVLGGCSARRQAESPDSALQERLERLEAENEALTERLAKAESARDDLLAQRARAGEAEEASADSPRDQPAATDTDTDKDLPVVKLAPPHSVDREPPRRRPVVRAEGKASGTVAHLDESDDDAAKEGSKPFNVVGAAIPPLYDRAVTSFEKGQFRLAIALCSEFMSRYSEHPYADNALDLRAKARLQLGDEEGARKDWEKLLADFPRDNKAPAAMLSLAGLFAARGEEERAEKTYEALLAQYPNDAVVDEIPPRYLP